MLAEPGSGQVTETCTRRYCAEEIEMPLCVSTCPGPFASCRSHRDVARVLVILLGRRPGSGVSESRERRPRPQSGSDRHALDPCPLLRLEVCCSGHNKIIMCLDHICLYNHSTLSTMISLLIAKLDVSMAEENCGEIMWHIHF